MSTIGKTSSDAGRALSRAAMRADVSAASTSQDDAIASGIGKIVR
jgi:hypothetical protein